MTGRAGSSFVSGCSAHPQFHGRFAIEAREVDEPLAGVGGPPRVLPPHEAPRESTWPWLPCTGGRVFAAVVKGPVYTVCATFNDERSFNGFSGAGGEEGVTAFAAGQHKAHRVIVLNYRQTVAFRDARLDEGFASTGRSDRSSCRWSTGRTKRQRRQQEGPANKTRIVTSRCVMLR